MCFESMATALTTPPCVSSTTSPVTVDWLEARKASRSVFSGSWKKPSYTSSTHLRTMRGEQRDQARRFEDDAALQTDRRVAGVDATADAVRREKCIEFRQQLVARDLLAVEGHGFAIGETKRHAQRLCRPFGARLAP